MTEENEQKANTGDESDFRILRIYLKDVSFETPNSPSIFLEEWKPEIKIELNSAAQQIEEDLHEVVLNITVTATQGDKTAFLVEVQQAGLFAMKGFEKEQRESMLGSYCLHAIYPYAREAISDLVTKGGFPLLLLSPINFDQFYRAKKAQAATEAG